MPHLAFYSSLCAVGPKAKLSKLTFWKIYSCLKGSAQREPSGADGGERGWGAPSELVKGICFCMLAVGWLLGGSDPASSVPLGAAKS